MTFQRLCSNSTADSPTPPLGLCTGRLETQNSTDILQILCCWPHHYHLPGETALETGRLLFYSSSLRRGIRVTFQRGRAVKLGCWHTFNRNPLSPWRAVPLRGTEPANFSWYLGNVSTETLQYPLIEGERVCPSRSHHLWHMPIQSERREGQREFPRCQSCWAQNNPYLTFLENP